MAPSVDRNLDNVPRRNASMGFASDRRNATDEDLKRREGQVVGRALQILGLTHQAAAIVMLFPDPENHPVSKWCNGQETPQMWRLNSRIAGFDWAYLLARAQMNPALQVQLTAQCHGRRAADRAVSA